MEKNAAPISIAHSRWYDTISKPRDTSIHAWRDPFFYIDNGIPTLLISAKDRKAPLGAKGAIAIIRNSTLDLTTWTTEPPLFSPHCFSECEVPQIYENKNKERILVFSVWAKHDQSTYSNHSGGLHFHNLETAQSGVLVPESENLYACRVITELQCIVGFDTVKGGLRKIPLNMPLLKKTYKAGDYI